MDQGRQRRRLILAILSAVPAGYRGRRPFGPQTISFRAVTEAAAEVGMGCVVLTPSSVTPAGGLRGWRWSDGRWRPTVLRRLPDVVYNRVPRRSLERQPEVRRFFAWLAVHQVPVFNPGFLDKAQLYYALAADPEARLCIPPTRVVYGPDDIRRVLGDWETVVLKPVNGCLGRSVLVLESRPGGVLCRPGGRGPGPRGRFRSVNGLLARVPALGRPGRWLVQRAVDRLTWHGRPADVRALIQRRPDGAWAVTGMAVRVAGHGRFVTHVPQGGSRLPLESLLARLPAGPVRDGARRALDHACLAAAKAVEAWVPGIWGELSVDLALDRQGRAWVLECNAKPMRFDEPDIRRRHFRGLASFARALAEGWRPPALSPEFETVAGAGA